jgi:hypothetical protein
VSKENVALFVRMTAEKRDLSRKASGAPTTAGWISLGKDVGLTFGEGDVVGFVQEITGKKVNDQNAITEFLAAMTSDALSDADLDQVSAGTVSTGGLPIAYSSALSKSMVRAGYVPPGGISGATYNFPPDPVPKSTSSGFQGGGGISM